MNIGLPSIATTIAGAVLAVLVALNDQVFHLGHAWAAGLNIAIVWAGVLGISVVTGAAFRAAVHVSQGVAAAIATTLTVIQLALGQADLSSTARTILQVLVVAAGTLGFGPTISVVAARAVLRLDGRKLVPSTRRGLDG